MTPDVRQRSLSRLSATGDLHAQARLLVERLRAESPCPECAGKGRYRRGHSFCPSCAGTGKERTCTRCHGAEPEPVYVSCGPCAGFGSVLRARVALAAYAGSEAALLAFDCPHDDIRGGDRGCVCHYGRGGGNYDFARFLAPLSRWSARPFHAPVRAGLALGYCALFFEQRRMRGVLLRAHRTFNRVQAWLDNPSESNKEQLLWLGDAETSPLWVSGSAFLVCHGDKDAAGDSALLVSAQSAAEVAGEPAIRTAIQEALVSWSLS